tara:strand:+ start:835 stop:2418 length:1584 start_codon:yes stop_codon:yes gene_type:complete
MKNPLIGIVILLFPIVIFAQNKSSVHKKAFDSIFFHTYMETATTDLNKALGVADSLYKTSKTNIFKVRSLMLISDIYHRKANRDSSIHYATIAEEIANDANIYTWQARISGVLSTQYRNMGLQKQGKVYLERGLEASKMIEDVNVANQFKGQVFQEKGCYALSEEQYNQAIRHFTTAQFFFKPLPQSQTRSSFLSQTEEQLGTAFLRLKKLDSAQLHYEKGLDLANLTSDGKTVFKGFIFLGLGEVYLAKKKYQKAIDNLDKALDISNSAGLPDFKANVYKTLAQYYKAIGNIDQYTTYNEQYLMVVQNSVKNNQHYADNIITKTEYKLKNIVLSRKVIFICALILMSLLLLKSSLIFKRMQKKEQQLYREMVKELKNPTGLILQKSTETPSLIPNRNVSDDRLMSKETETALLEQLKIFEQGEQYLQPNLTLPQLSVELHVNTKYLSYAINNHKGSDFNNYINRLRILYILKKLRECPEYLDYKIGYLSYECGFSSHSKFTATFKNVTGLTPSSFINQVRKEQNGE